MSLAKKFLTVALLSLAASSAAQAHSFWLLPSSTVLSAAGEWVTVDAARSNAPFYFNHNAMALDDLRITAPDGRRVAAENRHAMQLRSVFDLHIKDQGTYAVANVGEGLMARYETADGESRRWFGDLDSPADEIPEAAREAGVRHYAFRAETFVTAGAPSRTALEPTGEGLELVAETHPNDLYAGETATFALQVDGEPAADVEVEVVPGDVRYRSQRNAIQTTTDAEGRFTVTWPRAGMFHLETRVSDDRVGHEAADERRMDYAATFEVLPL